MVTVLFVCYGNICRSPMAEFVFRSLTEKAGLSEKYACASAATSSEELGNAVYPPVQRLLASHKIDCSQKTARQLTRADYDRYDLLIGMDAANLRDMQRLFQSDPQAKIRLFLSFAGETRDVADPWYTRDFQQCWQDVERGCKALLDRLEEKTFEEGSI